MTEYLVFVGPPGSGKTTQIRMLEASLGASDLLIASVPRLVRKQPELMELLTPLERLELEGHPAAAQQAKEMGELAPIQLDELLFRAVGRTETPLVVLDGCPRGVGPARVYLGLPHLSSKTRVVHLIFSPQEMQFSIGRQYARELEKGARRLPGSAKRSFNANCPSTSTTPDPGLRLSRKQVSR